MSEINPTPSASHLRGSIADLATKKENLNPQQSQQETIPTDSGKGISQPDLASIAISASINAAWHNPLAGVFTPKFIGAVIQSASLPSEITTNLDLRFEGDYPIEITDIQRSKDGTSYSFTYKKWSDGKQLEGKAYALKYNEQWVLSPQPIDASYLSKAENLIKSEQGANASQTLTPEWCILFPHQKREVATNSKDAKQEAVREAIVTSVQEESQNVGLVFDVHSRGDEQGLLIALKSSAADTGTPRILAQQWYDVPLSQRH